MLAKIAVRQPDYKQYIVPQVENAGLIFRVSPVIKLDEDNEFIRRLKLQVIIKNGMYCERLSPCLIGLAGLQVDETITSEGWVCLEIEGDIHADDIALLVKILTPELEALLCHNPIYRDGMEGIMQLIALIEIDTHFKQRL